MTQEWDEEYDVVVGSGGGALTGAQLAARAGLETVVVADSTESARAYLQALLGDSDADKREAFPGTGARPRRAAGGGPGDRVQVFPDYFDRPGRVPGGRLFVPRALGPAELGDLLACHRTGHGAVLTDTRMDELVTTPERVNGFSPSATAGASASAPVRASCWLPAASSKTSACAAPTASPAAPTAPWHRPAPTPANPSKRRWRSARPPGCPRPPGPVHTAQ
ncbi:hypothetical protein ACFV9W_01430 [Streptomyces sp. NPDC059897]|uniref:hypothetical protein n=1 Tax=Streptomyces sp. NPDC059897 TaxID=3346994 RepID=UPI003669E018